MNRYCKYHPGAEALWYCSHDGLYLCQQCVDGRNDSLIEARCLLCNQELESSEQGQGGPLWRQLDRYLRYPFAPVLLPLLVLWALLASLVPPLPVMVPVVLLAGLPTWGFARAVMTLRSHPGKARKSSAPGWDCLTDMAGWRAALLQALPALLVMVPAGFVLLMVSVPVGLLIGAVGLLLVPAFWLAIQAQGSEPGSYAAALTYIFSAPRDYAVAALLASVGWLLGVALVAVAVDVMPLPLAQGLAGALAAVWWLALACLCGDILARHGRLWGLDQGGKKVTTSLEERRQRVQLCAGRFDKVLLSTAKTLKSKKATVGDWQRYDRLLDITGRHDERRSAAPTYLEMLVVSGAWTEALALLARQREVEPTWLP
ncbi:MAG TPA: hypothetical protein DC022_17590, partial [Alcanivorax sp.]|nr:hypothetical protein [Alcanivorax sp.]